jgi:flavin reductase (DIM6/NTAB) family NADH-FMN oxidoreductase RutF
MGTGSASGAPSRFGKEINPFAAGDHPSGMKGRTDHSRKDVGFETISPKILYFGTPVAIVSSANEDGSTNLAPVSSFWALGWTIVLGLLRDTKTLQNLEQRPECVVNLPSPEMWKKVERLAPLTGLNPVPQEKAAKFRHERDKFRQRSSLRWRSESGRFSQGMIPRTFY